MVRRHERRDVIDVAFPALQLALGAGPAGWAGKLSGSATSVT